MAKWLVESEHGRTTIPKKPGCTVWTLNVYLVLSSQSGKGYVRCAQTCAPGFLRCGWLALPKMDRRLWFCGRTRWVIPHLSSHKRPGLASPVPIGGKIEHSLIPSGIDFPILPVHAISVSPAESTTSAFHWAKGRIVEFKMLSYKKRSSLCLFLLFDQYSTITWYKSTSPHFLFDSLCVSLLFFSFHSTISSTSKWHAKPPRSMLVGC